MSGRFPFVRRLSGRGEILAGFLAVVLCHPIAAFAADTTLVPLGSVWRYLDDGSDQGTAWSANAYNDSGWGSGAAELGYGDSDEATVVGYGPDSSNKYPTTYFRHEFPVSDPTAFTTLNLGLRRDDGAVVYLNGTEVFRSNIPAGPVSYSTFASSTIGGSGEKTLNHADLDAALLQSGTNLLAVEVHQRTGTSSDISFDLQLVASDDPASVTRGPYLQMGTEDAITVRWRTSAPVDGRVYYGTDMASLSYFVDGSSSAFEHEIRLTGLLAGETYDYSVAAGVSVLAGGDADHYFVTAPPIGTPVPTRVCVLGDSGTADTNAAAERDGYVSYNGGAHTDLWLMLGDNAYNDGTDQEYQDAVFDMYPSILRSSVLWPMLGNHDGRAAESGTQSGPYYDIFTLPASAEAGGVVSGTEAYYSFDFGDIHFVTVDSYESDRSPAGAMLTWLEQDLASTNARWIVAFWHHPPYSKGSHDSDTETRMQEMRQNVLPILDDYGVDLVLTGHSHAYERSMLIDSHYGHSFTLDASMIVNAGDGSVSGDGAYRKSSMPLPHEGAVYAVAGSSGKISGGPLNHPAMHVSLNELGSMVLDFSANVLDAVFLDHNGAVADEFRIERTSVCGNGFLESGEECDSGDLGGAVCGDADCNGGTPVCSATCTVDYSTCSSCGVCNAYGAVAAMDRPRVALKKVGSDAVSGNDILRVQGEIVLSAAGVLAAADPMTGGAQVILTNQAGTDRVDITVPGGAFDGTSGWRSKGGGLKLEYLDRSKPLQFNGLQKIVLREKSRSGKFRLQVTVKGKKGSYPVIVGDEPMNAALLVGAAPGGTCAKTSFVPGDCRFNTRMTDLSCR